MMWMMMWVTRTMATTMPEMMLAKGMVGMPAGRGGGGLLAEYVAAVAAAAVTAAAAVAAYCRGCCFSL